MSSEVCVCCVWGGRVGVGGTAAELQFEAGEGTESPSTCVGRKTGRVVGIRWGAAHLVAQVLR